MKADFDRLAPAERRIILVASDDKYQALVNELDRRKLLGLLPLLLSGGASVLGGGTAGVYLLQTLRATYGALSRAPDKEGRKPGVKGLLSGAFRKGEIVLPHLSPAEAAQRFRFDPGDPEDGAAYLESPIERDHYLRPALANERLAQEKVSAFVRLAAALGAKRIVLDSASSDERSGRGKAALPLPQFALNIGVAAGFASDGSARREVFMEFDPPRRPPEVPADLEPWLRAEPVLRALAETRLHARPSLVRAALSFGDTLDFGADAMGALAKLSGRGVALGGVYRRVVKSTFRFEIEYHPAP